MTVFKHIFCIVGQLEKAAEHYEAFYHLTAGRLWKDETGRTHNSLACENLWRIYTLLSEKMLENREWQQAIKTLIKALDMAREGRWKTTQSYFLFFNVLLIFLPMSKLNIVKCLSRWSFPSISETNLVNILTFCKTGLLVSHLWGLKEHIISLYLHALNVFIYLYICLEFIVYKTINCILINYIHYIHLIILFNKW